MRDSQIKIYESVPEGGIVKIFTDDHDFKQMQNMLG